MSTFRVVLIATLVMLLSGPAAWFLSLNWQRHQVELIIVKAETDTVARAAEFNRRFNQLIIQLRGLPAILSHEELLLGTLDHAPPHSNKPANDFLTYFTKVLAIDRTMILSADGICLDSSDATKDEGSSGENYADTEYFKAAMRNELGIQYAVGRQSQIPGIFFSSPILRGGRVDGVAVVKLNISTVERILSTRDIFVTDRHGMVILSSNPEWMFSVIPDASFRSMTDDEDRLLADRRKASVLPITSVDGKALIVRLGASKTPTAIATATLGVDGMQVHAFERLDRLADLPRQRLKFLILGYVAIYAVIWGALISILYVMRTRSHQRDLNEMASRDPLTGALNRRAFSLLSEREVARARRTEQPLSVLMMDLDHFKQVNDHFGHAGGDALLCLFVNVLEQVLRGQDVFCRFGGEEFVALLPATSSNQAFVVAERLRTVFSADTSASYEHSASPGSLALTVSVGISELHFDEGLDSAIQRADTALYRAKQLGRNRCEIADPQLPLVTPL